MKKFLNNLVIVFLISSSMYYIFLNKNKMKWSIIRWKDFKNYTIGKFPLRAHCSVGSLKIEKLFMESLIVEDEISILWMKNSLNGIQKCFINETSVDINICNFNNIDYKCLIDDKVKIYLWDDRSKERNLILGYKEYLKEIK